MRSFFKIPFVIICILVCFHSGNIAAVEPEKEPYKNIFTFSIDNDFFLFKGTDKHYTNGFKINWLMLLEEDDEILQAISSNLPYMNDSRLNYFGLEFGQLMFTPEDPFDQDVIYEDRPYAGWLYLSSYFDRVEEDEYERWMLTLGVTGPMSLAHPTQDFVHWVKEVKIFEGWDNQLNNEFGANLTYKRAYRTDVDFKLFDCEIDFISTIGGTLGTVFTHFGGGHLVRIGHHLPDSFGPETIQPMLTGSPNFFSQDPNIFWYFYAGSEGRVVGRNMFLDGNLFSDSHSVDKNMIVVDLFAGFSFQYHNVNFGYMHVFRSPEFDTQHGWHQFGSFIVNYQF